MRNGVKFTPSGKELLALSFSRLRRTMLAASSNAHKQKEELDPPPSEGPSVESLRIPDSDIISSSTAALLRLVQKSSEMRIGLYSTFDDCFENLVTRGKADEYSGLVDRFKLKFSAIDDTLGRVCDRLHVASQPALVAMVQTVIREERDRLAAKLDEQVLRQHLSTTDLESEERPALKKRVQDVSSSLASKAAAVEDALEELRAEAADLDVEDE